MKNREYVDLILENTDETCESHIFISEFRNIINNLRIIMSFNDSPRMAIKKAFSDYKEICTHATMKKILDGCITRCRNPFFKPVFEVERLNRIFDRMSYEIREVLRKDGVVQ